MRSLIDAIELVAPTDAAVLIQGETGSGKDVIARAVHALSTRAKAPFIKVNCGALPEGLVESELFGHGEGAFTGAVADRIGRFELADGGTLFLDEVGELPLDAQVKLLRVLQEGEFERVGRSETQRVDVRIVAATNRDLKERVASDHFRQDLFYRLSVVPVEVPPLRDRAEDVPQFVRHFVAKHAPRLGRNVTTVDPETMERLVRYSWPGNVRELENVIERALILSAGPTLNLETNALTESPGASPSGDAMQLAVVERQHIERMLQEAEWVVDGPSGAAQSLGLHPSTLRNRMRKLGIRRPD
jgi:formate hydrogenlyase transcriptional activator